MNSENTDASRNAMLIGIVTTLAGVGVFVWKRARKTRETRLRGAARTGPPGIMPVWAQASAIVASSVSALLLLVRQKA